MYKLGIEALGERALHRGIPLEGMFELTERCNLRCRFCYVCDRSAGIRQETEKTAREWLQMIRQAVDSGMLTCTFTGGEPFIREDFEEIYCKAYDMGLRLIVFTNATLIGEREIAFLSKRKPDYLSISLYGATEESYRELCGTGGGFHRVAEAIDLLLGAGLNVELKTLALHPLLHEYEAIGQFAAEHHCPVKIDVYLGPCRDDPQLLLDKWRIPASKVRFVLDSLKNGYDHPLKHANGEIHHAPGPQASIPAIPCMAGRRNFMITHDGRMLGCPTLTEFETYPFTQGFQTAWVQLREMVQHAPCCLDCATCPDFEACYLCPANRMKETGSIALCSAYLRDLAHALLLYTKDNVG